MPKKNMSMSEIKTRFPEEWRRLQQAIKEQERDSLPPVPVSVLKKLRKEIKSLCDDGEQVELPPTPARPFSLRFQIIWEEDVRGYINDVEIYPAPKASAAEKKLVQLLKTSMEASGYNVIENYSYEREVTRAPQVKAFDRRIAELIKEGEALEKKYKFCLDDLIEEWL
jgi:hypothetical protein